MLPFAEDFDQRLGRGGFEETRAKRRVVEIAGETAEKAEMGGVGAGWADEEKDEGHRLVVRRTEFYAGGCPADRECGFGCFLRQLMRYREAVADSRRRKLLALEYLFCEFFRVVNLSRRFEGGNELLDGLPFPASTELEHHAARIENV